MNVFIGLKIVRQEVRQQVLKSTNVEIETRGDFKASQ